MDRVLRAYAHTAWTPADPLSGLDPEMRRAILLMPPTFRERWKLAPWTDRHQRHVAILDIVAERRLLYELTHQKLEKATPLSPSADATVLAEAVASPYYRYRMALHRQAVDSLQQDRAMQDQRDLAALPEARDDRDRRAARRQALLAVEIERTKLELRELEILADHEPHRIAATPLPTEKSSPRKSRRREIAR